MGFCIIVRVFCTNDGVLYSTNGGVLYYWCCLFLQSAGVLLALEQRDRPVWLHGGAALLSQEPRQVLHGETRPILDTNQSIQIIFAHDPAYEPADYSDDDHDSALFEEQSKFPRYNRKCRGKPDTI